MSHERPAELEPYRIQLLGVHAIECRAQRKDSDPEGVAEPTFDANLLRTSLDESRLNFSVRLSLHAQQPVGAVLSDCRVTVQGEFASTRELTEEEFEEFTAYTPLVLLWPYARAYLGSLGALLGLPLPALPTLDALARPGASEEPPE